MSVKSEPPHNDPIPYGGEDNMDDEQAKQRSPVVLSKKSLATAEGVALLELLERIMADGRLADQEITELAAWLEQTALTSTLPGIHFLREEVVGILADGAVSEAESRLLRNAILRVLPITERERVKAKAADATAREREERTAAANRATLKQLEFIRDLGGTCADNVTKQEASEIIDRLLTSRPTARQRMVLRFWNRLDLLTDGVEGVSAWMDRWYAEDPHRLEAWTLWKRESGDNEGRSPSSIDSVPLGAGQEYLVRVKARMQGHRRAQTDTGGNSQVVHTRHGGYLGQIIIACLSLLAIALVILWLRQ